MLLYGYAMSKPLSLGGSDIKWMSENQNEGYIFEVDLS